VSIATTAAASHDDEMVSLQLERAPKPDSAGGRSTGE
jgi:hypothetical protein